MNSRLDEIQAAILLVKLKYIDKWNALRAEHAADYAKALKGLPLTLPSAAKGDTHIYHLYSILTEKRNELQEFLMKREIGCGVYYPLPMHLQPCYKELGYKKGDFPHCERVVERILSLPMYPELTKKSKSLVIHAIGDFFKKI